MIQRVQTLYLLLAAILIFSSLALPLATYQFEFTGETSTELKEETNSFTVQFSGLDVEADHYAQSAENLKDKVDGMLNMGLIGMIALGVLVLVSIFMFKNRKRQVLIVRFCMLLALIAFAGIVFGADYGADMVAEHFNEIEGLTITSSIDYGAYFPAASVAFMFLAQLRIMKDEKLVKSLDRIR